VTHRWCLLIALLVAACGHRVPAPISTTQVTPAICQIGPDGGPVVADRGIGGTGIDNNAIQTADRGIGGTGIVGVVTGFSSVCVAGLEVSYDSTTPVSIAGSPASVDELRAGQVVAIDATQNSTGLRATNIRVRHEVTGPVQSVLADGVLTVAGQRVILDPAVRGVTALKRGDWVAVSGIRRPEGAVVATRVDYAIPGVVTVHGRLDESNQVWRMGGLIVHPAPGSTPPSGIFVVATGEERNSELFPDSVVPDLLVSNPLAYFGDAVQRFVIESFVRATDGTIETSGGFSARIAGGPSEAGLSNAPARAVVALQRQDHGVAVMSVQLGTPTENPLAPSGVGPGRQLAPMPNEESDHTGTHGAPAHGGRTSDTPARDELNQDSPTLPLGNGGNAPGFGEPAPGSGPRAAFPIR
jgi:hypothetical protein